MALKFLPKVSTCFWCVPLPAAALLIAFCYFMFTAANVYLFLSDMICKEDYCKAVWLQVVFLAPYAWLCLAGAILIITYFDNQNKDLLMFAIMIKLVLIFVFLIIWILIFVKDELHNDFEGGIIFLSLGSVFLFFQIYFTIVVNSWQGTL